MFSTITSFGQARFEYDLIFNDGLDGKLVSASALYDAGSNAITNSLYDETLISGRIEEEQKEDTYSKLATNNRFGLDLGANVLYRQGRDSSHAFYINLKDRNFRYFTFEENLLRLVLSGNRQFIGQNVDLGDLYLRHLRYQSIGFGFQKKLNENLFISGGLNFVKSGFYQDLSVMNMSFFIDSDVTEINVQADYNRQVSVKDDLSNYVLFRGVGASVDIEVAYMIKKDMYVGLKVQDLGALHFANLTSSDTLVNMSIESFEIDDFFAANALTSFNQDEIVDFEAFEESSESASIVLPAHFSLIYQHRMASNFLMNAQLRYQLSRAFLPELAFTPSYLIKGFEFGVRNRLGGYSNYDFGLHLAKVFVDKYGFSIDLLNFESVFLPRSSTGQSLFMTLSARL